MAQKQMRNSNAVTLTLSLAEARALSRGMGNSIDDYETALSIFLHPATVAAAYRAADKLSDAIRAAQARR